MSGYLLNVIQCADTRRMMRKALDSGWEWVGYTKGGHVEIRWPATGALLHCATTPGDANSWKAFARNVKQVSGVDVRNRGNRRRSRKPLNQPDRQIEAARRKHAERIARAARDEADETRRSASAIESDQHRRDIESLMQPGWGR